MSYRKNQVEKVKRKEKGNPPKQIAHSTSRGDVLVSPKAKHGNANDEV